MHAWSLLSTRALTGSCCPRGVEDACPAISPEGTGKCAGARTEVQVRLKRLCPATGFRLCRARVQGRYVRSPESQQHHVPEA